MPPKNATVAAPQTVPQTDDTVAEIPKDDAVAPTDTDTPMTKEEVTEVTATLQQYMGSRVTMTWRLKGHGKYVSAGEVTTSGATIFSMEDGRPHLLLDEDKEDEDPVFVTLTPFPNGDVEYFKVQVHPGTKPKAVKRPRAATPAAEALSNADLAQHLIDGKAGKRTVEVPCSEGLRVPVNTPKPFSALYPNLFWAKKERGEPVDKVVAEWEGQLTQLQTHMGAVAIRAPQVRDDLDLCRQTILQSMRVTIADRPADRKQWRSLFWHTINFLKICIQVANGAAAAAAVETQARTSFNKGLMDFEELIGSMETPAAPVHQAPTQGQASTPGAANGVSVQEFRSFQAEMSKTIGLIQQFLHQNQGGTGGNYRGRGRGRGRGGF
jgi:hypothetical protein